MGKAISPVLPTCVCPRHPFQSTGLGSGVGAGDEKGRQAASESAAAIHPQALFFERVTTSGFQFFAFGHKAFRVNDVYFDFFPQGLESTKVP